jgi:hypothetical protein
VAQGEELKVAGSGAVAPEQGQIQEQTDEGRHERRQYGTLREGSILCEFIGPFPAGAISAPHRLRVSVGRGIVEAVIPLDEASERAIPVPRYSTVPVSDPPPPSEQLRSAAGLCGEAAGAAATWELRWPGLADSRIGAALVVHQRRRIRLLI